MSDGQPQDDFVHLHVHSVYSLLDGAIRLSDLVKHVKELGMSAVAVTDHGNMFGAVEFYKEAKAAGIKPIIGSEFYVAPGSRFDRQVLDKLADGNNYHLVLLAKNMAGYKNLIKLSSRSYTEGFYNKPRIDYELLANHTEGLIATSACLGGEINRRILQGEMQKAEELALHLDSLFGRGNFFLEIQNHGIPEQEVAARGAVEIHRRTGIPLVLTNDAHFLRRQDQKAQEIMLRIQLKKKIDEPLAFAFNEEFYIKTGAEMRALFPELPEASLNTRRIADQVDLDFEFGKALLPDFITPAGQSLSQYLDELALAGLQKKFSGPVPEKYMERLQYELGVIHKMGFDGYFLIVADFINHAKDKGIPVGPGRGSAAGSLVAYSTGITNLDPLRYDLLFERFLNPSRNEMPDIDIDFCRDRREEVISYVIEKYGADHVSQIITFGTLSARAVIKDVARVMDFNFADINSLSKHLSDKPGVSLQDAVANAPEVRDFFNAGEREKLLYQVACTLEGIPRNAGKHAAGVVIAPEPLENIIPLAKDTKTNVVISQFEKGPLESVGLVKMDFLGLKNLSIIQRALDEIELRQHKKLDINNIPLDDAKTYQLLQKGLTKGIFQVEQPGMTKLLVRARPQKFEDIIACLALYRPGPLQSGMTEGYVRRKNGEEKVEYPHPDLEPVLRDTYGTIVYQEQVMLISQVVAGFSMSEADALRKAMGKKSREVMEKMKKKFIEGAEAKKYKADWASALYDKIAEFAEYGFNKSHSAAYGLITYQTAYLKAHYPLEYMKALLDSDIEQTDSLIGFIQAARSMGIEILPPDINVSEQFFTITGPNTIRYGLLGLKGMGQAAVEAIIAARQEGPFKDVLDLASRLDSRQFNRRLLEVLICSGALDSLGQNRASLYAAVEDILAIGASARQDKESGQESLFAAFGDQSEPVLSIGQKPEWGSDEKMRLEKETLGLYLTAHPLDGYRDLIGQSRLTPIEDLDDGHSSERKISLMGIIEEVEVVNTKRGTTFYLMKLSDQTGMTAIRVYKNLYEQARALLAVHSIVIVECKVNIYREDESVQIMATALKVQPAAEIDAMLRKSLHIFIDPQKLAGNLQQRLREIKSVLQQYRGEYPVYLHYRNEDGAVRAAKVHQTFYVDYTRELTEKLQKGLQSDRLVAWRVGGQVRVGEESHQLQVH